MIKDVIIIISVSINMTGCDNVCETITKHFTQIADNYSLVFVIFISFFGQLKDWVGQVLFLLVVRRDKLKNMLM